MYCVEYTLSREYWSRGTLQVATTNMFYVPIEDQLSSNDHKIVMEEKD